MKLQTNKDGYIRINLFKDGKKTHYSINKLVAYAFITDKPENYEKLQVNHIDGNKSNNNIQNLEYVTSQENYLHSSRVLLNGCKEVQMLDYKTGELLKTFPSLVMTAKHVNRSSGFISNVCRGKKNSCAGYKFKYVDKSNLVMENEEN